MLSDDCLVVFSARLVRDSCAVVKGLFAHKRRCNWTSGACRRSFPRRGTSTSIGSRLPLFLGPPPPPPPDGAFSAAAICPPPPLRAIHAFFPRLPPGYGHPHLTVHAFLPLLELLWRRVVFVRLPSRRICWRERRRSADSCAKHQRG